MKNAVVLCFIGVVLFACDSIKSESNKNVEEMIQHMENFHKDCEGESILFRASGERTAIEIWDSKYPVEDVDKAIKQLKTKLLTDSEIREVDVTNSVLRLSKRSIK
jgi:hypothetical protein